MYKSLFLKMGAIILKVSMDDSLTHLEKLK